MAYFSVPPWGISSEKLVIISNILIFQMSNSPKVLVLINFLRDLLCLIEKMSLICGNLVNSSSLSHKMVLFSILPFFYYSFGSLCKFCLPLICYLVISPLSSEIATPDEISTRNRKLDSKDLREQLGIVLKNYETKIGTLLCRKNRVESGSIN